MITMPPKSTALWSIAAVLFALLWTAGIYALGWNTARVQADLRQVQVELASERAIQVEKDRLQGEKEALQADMNLMAESHKKEMADAQQTTDRLVADLRAGRARLSVPIKAPVCPAADGGASTPAAGDQEARAELAPATAADLAAIVAAGDQSIRDLNTVIDLYERARQLKCF